MYCFNFGLSCSHVIPNHRVLSLAMSRLHTKHFCKSGACCSQDQNVEEEANIGQPTSLAASFSRFLQLHRRLTVQLDVKSRSGGSGDRKLTV